MKDVMGALGIKCSRKVLTAQERETNEKMQFCWSTERTFQSQVNLYWGSSNREAATKLRKFTPLLVACVHGSSTVRS